MSFQSCQVFLSLLPLKRIFNVLFCNPSRVKELCLWIVSSREAQNVLNAVSILFVFFRVFYCTNNDKIFDMLGHAILLNCAFFLSFYSVRRLLWLLDISDLADVSRAVTSTQNCNYRGASLTPFICFFSPSSLPLYLSEERGKGKEKDIVWMNEFKRER